MSLNALVDYDDSPAPGADGEDDEQGAAAPAPALLSIVDYGDPNAVPPKAPDNLGVSLDDDELLRSSSRRVGSVQVSVVKRAKAADGVDAPAATKDMLPVEEDDGPARPAFEVPPSPNGEVNPKVMDKFEGFVKSSQEGNRVNDYIRHAKRFRNPDLLEKLVSYMDVVENGTNYPSELYDPAAFDADEYYEGLEKARQQFEQRQSRKPGERVQFQSSGQLEAPRPTAQAAATTTSSSSAVAPADGAAVIKRKSKWDTGGEPDAQRARKL